MTFCFSAKLEEKLRLQKLQEENDLKLAADMLGLGGSSGGVIDSMTPSTKEEFENLTKAITDKVNSFYQQVFCCIFRHST